MDFRDYSDVMGVKRDSTQSEILPDSWDGDCRDIDRTTRLLTLCAFRIE